MENFLLIAGSKGSGKGLIRGLLDGHPELFVSPFHELVLDSFYQNKKKEKLIKKDIEEIRGLLASKGSYYQLERLSYEKKRNVHLAGGLNDKGVNIGFDFYSFDKLWVDKLHKKGKKWKSTDICIEIYKSFNEHFFSPYLKKNKKKKYFCTLSNGEYSSLSKFLKTFSSSKVIYIKRDPIEIIASIIKRKKSPYNVRSGWFVRKELFKMYGSRKFIKSLLDFDYEAKKISKLFPKRILIIEFKNFFENLKEETLKIKNFLNISMNSSLKYYSNSGYEMKDNLGNSLLTQPIDIGYGDLTKSELLRLKIILNKVKKD